MPNSDKDKQRATWRAWYHRNKAKKNATQARMGANLREWFNAMKSTMRCERCDESDPACLAFHHRSGEKKVAAIADGIRKAWSKSRILAEIAKCAVLCANCHLKEHYDERLAAGTRKIPPKRVRGRSPFTT